MAKKKVPTVEARCPMCKNAVEYVWTGTITQVVESITDDEFSEPKLRKLNAGDVHDPGGSKLIDRLVCTNPTCAFDVVATQDNLRRLRPENNEPREWAPGKEPTDGENA